MTRVTLAELKRAKRDGSVRRAPPGTGNQFPTPMPTAASAVRRFHRVGAAPALAAINQAFDQSTYWGPKGPAQARGWAEAIRACFQTYVDLASPDGRPTLGSPVSGDVDLGTNQVGVALDVVLLDPRGYVGRYLLWDRPALIQDDAEILAAAVVALLEDELGIGRVAGAEVWHLRSGEQLFVDAATALARLREVRAVVSAYVS